MKKIILPLFVFLLPVITLAATSTIEFPNPIGNASFGVILSKVLIIAMWMGAVILTIMIVWAGYVLMLSKGDPKEIQKARSTILYGVVGYVILLFAEAIRLIIMNLLN